MLEGPGLLSGLLFFAALLVGGWFVLMATLNNRDNMRIQQMLFLSAFALRFAASLLLYQFGFVDVLRDEDASGWVIGRWYQHEWILQGKTLLDMPQLLAEGFLLNNRGYYHYLGVTFFVTGAATRLPAAAMNCFVGSLTVVMAYRTANTVFGRNIAVKAGWLACLFPSLIIWSSQTLKEPIVIFLESVALYGCTQLMRRGFSTRHLLLTIAAILAMIPFRFYAAYIAIVVIIIAFSIPRIERRPLAMNSRAGVWIVMIPVLLLTGYFLQKESQMERFNLEYVEQFREFASRDQGSGVNTNLDLHSPVGLALAITIGLLHLMLAPFPWQLAGGSLRMLLVGPELLMWWLIFFAAVIPGVRYALRKRFYEVLPVLCFIVGLGLLYSLMFSNVGLIYRQRAQLLPYFLIFAAVGLQLRTVKKYRQHLLPRSALTANPVTLSRA